MKQRRIGLPVDLNEAGGGNGKGVIAAAGRCRSIRRRRALKDPGADPGLAKAFYQLDQFAGVPLYWLTEVVILSVLIAAVRGIFPRWAVWMSTLFVALGGISVKAGGALAAGTGLLANIGFAGELVFLLEVGLLLWGARAPAQMTA